MCVAILFWIIYLLLFVSGSFGIPINKTIVKHFKYLVRDTISI
jgi:hypothetical protein